MATHYTVWHYQEQFGSIVFVTALQTAMGTYTSYPHLRGQSQKQFLRTAQSMLYLWQGQLSRTLQAIPMVYRSSLFPLEILC